MVTFADPSLRFCTGNWIAEFKKWCPSIHAVKMGGKRDEREKFIKQDLPLVNGKYQFDAVVTSYEGLLKEKNKLSKVPWKYLIIDEAHRTLRCYGTFDDS